MSGVSVVVGDRLLLAMEARGWIYYRRRKPDSTGAALGSALLTLQTFVQPSAQHVQEARQEVLSEDAEDGEGGAGTPRE